MQLGEEERRGTTAGWRCHTALCAGATLLVQAGVNFFILFTPGTWYSIGPHLSSVLAVREQALCKPSSGAYVTALGAVWKAPLLCEDLLGEPRASLPVFSRSKRQRREQECSGEHTCGVRTAVTLYQ